MKMANAQPGIKLSIDENENKKGANVVRFFLCRESDDTQSGVQVKI